MKELTDQTWVMENIENMSVNSFFYDYILLQVKSYFNN